jgi:acetoacetate decarboxylase
MNNIPIHAPLFTPDLIYGSDDAESVTVLVEVEEAAIRTLLEPTPFSFVSAHAWVEVIKLNGSFGVEPFCGGGVIVPASFGEVVGGYYAFCYIDTDDALALGREPFGYPKKYARSYLQRTGRAATAAMSRKDAHIELSVVIDPSRAGTAPQVPRYPHLLLQVLPSAQSSEVLLKRVIARDTAATSNMTHEPGEAAIHVRKASAANELAWLGSARPVFGAYSRGSFRGALGKVIATLTIGSELSDRQAEPDYAGDDANRPAGR